MWVGGGHKVSARKLKQTCLVMELCEGGELKKMLCGKGHFTENETGIIQSLASAIVCLQKNCIVRRDLKLENILVKSSDINEVNEVKLNVKVSSCRTELLDQEFTVWKRRLQAEKNFSIVLDFSVPFSLGQFVPSFLKMPELAHEVISACDYSQQRDIWSTGVIMYMLKFGRKAFELIRREDLCFKTLVWETVTKLERAKILFPKSLKSTLSQKEEVEMVMAFK
ncbi:LOW QUALITY PROTEIN: serine/threonine-protein kinase 33 [Cyanocitta cristata]